MKIVITTKQEVIASTLIAEVEMLWHTYVERYRVKN